MNEVKSIYDLIEDIVWELDITFLEATIIFCERKGIDVESVALIINKSQPLKDKIYEEAEILKMVEKTNRILDADWL